MFTKIKELIDKNKRLSIFFIVTLSLIIVLGLMNFLVRNPYFLYQVGAYDKGVTVSNDRYAAMPSVSSSNASSSQPIIKSFSASKYSINPGSSTTLTWSVYYANKVTINQGVGTVNKRQGSVNVSPTTTTTYTLMAQNRYGAMITSQVVIEVLSVKPPLPTATLTANPPSITQGATSTLSWTTTDASSVAIDQNIGEVYPISSIVVSPVSTTLYTLTVTNSSGTITKSVTITVTPLPAPTVNFSANPTSVITGNSSTLSWTTTNATSVSIDQSIGTVATSGTKSVTPQSTTTYTLIATGPGGSVTKTATVTVTPPLVLPTINSFSASPATITSGISATLSWNISGASSATIDQGVGTVSATSGTKSVSPTATTTYTITATNTVGSKTADVTVTVGTTPPDTNTGSPKLILRKTDIDAIKSRIANKQEPEYSAWNQFNTSYVQPAKTKTPNVFIGPQTTGGVGTPLELQLDKDGGIARNAALGYAINGDIELAKKSREFLVAWASSNVPTAYQDSGDKWGGSYQAHGAFMFAYAYDLINSSSVLSASDRATIDAYFKRFVDALDTYNAKMKTEWVITTNPTYTQPYQWDANKRYFVYDNYVGSDMVVLQQAARLGMARMIGYQAAIDGILNDSGNILGLQSVAKAALSPRNDGDGVNEGPAPQQHIYTKYTEGRGGMFDYMTYNTRVVHVLYEMAVNAGWDQAKSNEVRGRLQKSWTYMGRYFGPGAEPNFNPLDKINLTACVPRFALPYSAFGDQHFVDILNSQSSRSSYYEPQLLGPVTLTHSIVKPANVAVPTNVAKSVPEDTFLDSVKSFFTDIASSIANFFEKLFN